jgi:hypothetical protein
MKVKQLISELKKYPQDAEVIITDGYRMQFYKGDFQVTLFEKNKVDIGIGGCDEEAEENGSEETDAS